MPCDPTASPAACTLAVPVAITVAVPSVVFPSRKTTVPVTGCDPVPLIVSVNVTVCPKTDGFALEESEPASDCTISSVSVEEVEVAWFASPP